MPLIGKLESFTRRKKTCQLSYENNKIVWVATNCMDNLIILALRIDRQIHYTWINIINIKTWV